MIHEMKKNKLKHSSVKGILKRMKTYMLKWEKMFQITHVYHCIISQFIYSYFWMVFNCMVECATLGFIHSPVEVYILCTECIMNSQSWSIRKQKKHKNIQQTWKVTVPNIYTCERVISIVRHQRNLEQPKVRQ
jgi:hypothetical protein